MKEACRNKTFSPLLPRFIQSFRVKAVNIYKIFFCFCDRISFAESFEKMILSRVYFQQTQTIFVSRNNTVTVFFEGKLGRLFSRHIQIIPADGIAVIKKPESRNQL